MGTRQQVIEQMDDYGISFGERYQDPASGFEGVATALYFFQHGCLRVQLRGVNRTTGEPAEFTFDAPELVHVETIQDGNGVKKQRTTPVPAGTRMGGPRGLDGPPRRGIR